MSAIFMFQNLWKKKINGLLDFLTEKCEFSRPSYEHSYLRPGPSEPEGLGAGAPPPIIVKL